MDIRAKAPVEAGLAGAQVHRVLTLGAVEAGQAPTNGPMTGHFAAAPVEAVIGGAYYLVAGGGVGVEGVAGHPAFLAALGGRRETDEVGGAAGARRQSSRGIFTGDAISLPINR